MNTRVSALAATFLLCTGLASAQAPAPAGDAGQELTGDLLLRRGQARG